MEPRSPPPVYKWCKRVGHSAIIRDIMVGKPVRLPDPFSLYVPRDVGVRRASAAHHMSATSDLECRTSTSSCLVLYVARQPPLALQVARQPRLTFITL